MRRLIMLVAINLVIFGMAMAVSAEPYEVEKGDSLWKIANEHETTISHLMEINELESHIIYPKQKLEINEIYRVEKGDTLSHIAKDFQVTVDELKEWNELTSDLIRVDQELEIYPTKSEKVKRENKTEKKNSTIPKSKKVTSTKNETTNREHQSSNTPQGKKMSVVATAYTAECDGCTGVTFTGIDLNKDRNAKVIAVDPNVIPLGTEVYVEGYGRAIAGDIGGAIKGNRIDIHVPTKAEAYSWGVRDVEITILDE